MYAIFKRIFPIASFFALLLSSQCLGQATETKNGFEHYRDTRLRALDRNTRLSKAEHAKLWKLNIMLAVFGGAEKLQIDAFGLAQTAFIGKCRPALCTELMERFSDELVGQELKYSQLVEALLKLKSIVDSEWKKIDSIDFPKVIFRAELVDRYSKVRKRKETWLLVDIHHSHDPSDDVMAADFNASISQDRRGIVDGSDLNRQIQISHPDPRYEEDVHLLMSPPTLLRNRNKPFVTVAHDGLTASEREAHLGFHVINKTGFAVHQIEGIGGHGFDDLGERKQQFMLEALRLLQERLPNGSAVSLEELSLRIGSASKVLEMRFDDLTMEVTIVENKVGKGTYSVLQIEPRSR